MRRYYLHQRKGVYYAELFDPATGRKLPARSTFESDQSGIKAGRFHPL